MLSGTKKLLLLALVAVLLTTAISACSTKSQSTELHMIPLGEMPAEVQSAPMSVQAAYQFNSANPDIMEDIPCYCGCGDIGHTSNYSCYVSGVDDKGKIAFDNHALGCSICVDITLE
jgi:hypothetical protein